MFVGFVLGSGQFLALTDGTDITARAYVGALIVFDIAVILRGAFLGRSL